jgi:malic enzyme
MVVPNSHGVIPKSRPLKHYDRYQIKFSLDHKRARWSHTLEEGVKEKMICLSKFLALRTRNSRDCQVHEQGLDNLSTYKPVPEIHPKLAFQSSAKVMATGSYKFESRANNILVFPFTMRAILDNGYAS